MSGEIIKILDALINKFRVSIDWASSNIIPQLQELCGKYINYKIATSIMWIVIGFIVGISGLVWYKTINKHNDWGVVNTDYGCDNDLRKVLYISAILVSVLSLFIIFYQILNIITCVTFPEKIIINELQNIYDNMK